MSLIVGLISGGLLLGSALLQIRDVDLYWHLRAGQELRDGVPVDAIGSAWSYARDSIPWVTTQWLAEVTLHAVHASMGWAGLVAYRTITAAVAVALLAYSTLRGRPVILAGFPYLIAALATVAVSQERSNQASLIGAAGLGGVLISGLSQGRLPRWWLLLPATWIWASFHGGWVLVPMTLLLIALGRALDHGIRDRVAVGAVGLGLATVVTGTLTPAGTASTFAIFRFSGATDAIQEWRPTEPMHGLGYLTAVMAVLLVISLARTMSPVSVVVVSSILLIYSWTAVRNVAPALLLLAPLVADRLVAAFREVGRSPEPRWSAPSGMIAAGVLVTVGLAMLPGRELLPTDDYPVGLAARIAELPGAQRVLNEYNVAGMVLFFAGRDDQVGIDGRTDRYGSDYIDSYLDLTSLKGDWRPLLAELAPTSALLEADGPLAHVLVAERGWVVVAEEGDWVLLSGAEAK